MKIRDDFYGKPLYSNSLFQWEEVLKEYIPHFIWYHDEEDRRVGWCSYCGCFMTWDYDVKADIYSNYNDYVTAKHGENLCCPCCDYPVKFINEYKMRSYGSLVKTIRLIISDWIDDNHINFFAVRVRNYPEDGEEQFIEIEPVACYELSPGSVKMFRYRDGEWKQQKNYGEPFTTYFGHGGDYEFVLLGRDCEFDGTFLQYSMFNKFEDLGRSKAYFYGDRYFRYMTYLCDYCMYPQLEFLMKAGAYQWVYELVYDRNFNRQFLNWKANSYTEFFNMSKLELKAFMKCGLSASVLRLWHETNKKISLVELCDSYHNYSPAFHGQLVDLCMMYGIEIERLNKYFNSHMIPRDRHNSCLYDSTFQMWRDYIEACENVGVDLSDNNLLFPKDLPKAHDERVAQVTVKENFQLVARALRSLERRDKQYRFENEQFIIYIPHTVQELIDESNMQSNCVAKNYTDQHFRDECTICFLREKSRINESFYTIEIRGRTVWQKRGYLNDQPRRADNELKKERWAYYMSRPIREANAFYSLWHSWVKNGSPRDSKGNPIIETRKERKRA